MSKAHYEKNRKEILARLNAKYREDAKFRRKARSASRRRYHEDPEYRRLTNERALQRYYDNKLKAAQGQKRKSPRKSAT